MKLSTAAFAVLTVLALAGSAAGAAPKKPVSAVVKKPAAPAAAKKPTAKKPATAPAKKPASTPAPAAAAALPERTDALFVTPPEGWVVSAWGGGTVELAEFSPPGQVGDAYVDLLGFSLVPRLAGTNDSEDEMRAFERKKEGCRAIMVRDHEGAAGWYDSEYLCLGREGAKPDAVEIEFASTRLGKQSVMRIWRSWRGSPAELSRMLKDRLGLDLKPVRGEGDKAAADDKDLGAAYDALAPSFFADIGRSEVCDLAAPATCAGLHAPVPADLENTRPKEPFVAGFVAPGQHRLSREDFRTTFKLTNPDDGTPNRVIPRLLPTDPAWTDPNIFAKAVLAVSLGQAADGGAMYLVDREGKLDAAGRTAGLARLLAASRQLWQPGRAPDTIMVLGGD